MQKSTTGPLGIHTTLHKAGVRLSARQIRWCCVILCLLIFLTASLTAARNRLPWSDEGWFSSAAHTLATQGFMGTPVLDSRLELPRIQQRTFWVMPLFLLGQAAWYKVFPDTILSTRAFTIVSALGALLAFYFFLTGLLREKNVPLLAACLLSVSFIFIDNAGFARPDVLCGAFGLAGLAVFLALRESRWLLSLFLANTFIAASGFTHPNGLFHFFGLAVLVLWFDRRRLNVPALAMAALPYLLFALGWGLYIAQDVNAFTLQMKSNGTNDRWTSTLNPFLIVWNEISQRYFVAFGLVTGGFGYLKALALGAYISGVAGCLADSSLRRRPEVRLLFILLAVYFAGMSVFNQKLSYYLVHILPFYIALLALWIVALWIRRPGLRFVIAPALLLLCSVETTGIFLKARAQQYMLEQSPAMQFVEANTPKAGFIAGSASLLYELHFDPRLHDDPYLGLRKGIFPDVVIIDPLYKDLYQEWSAGYPSRIKDIRQRLSLYRLAFHNNDYEIYLPAFQKPPV